MIALCCVTACNQNNGVEDGEFMSIEEARKEVANALGGSPDGLYFTSGGTEANNLAIIGGALAKKRKGNKIVVSAYEHDSVIKSAKQLEEMGFSVTWLAPDENGIIISDDLKLVARALLPMEITEGCRVINEMLQYRML